MGSSARYAVTQLIDVAPGAFPWATFWTNVSGSFALGLAVMVLLGRFPHSRLLRPFLATGMLGAYTTFSAFAVETDLLVRDGALVVALVYATATLPTTIAAAWTGITLGKATSRRQRRTS